MFPVYLLCVWLISFAALMFRIILGGLEDLNVIIYTFLTQTPGEREAWMKDFVSILIS